jgi:hypothetical protein
MNRIITVLVFTLVTLGATAQINEVGVFLGGGNYIGDVGPGYYVSPNNFAGGIMYRWNRSLRHSYRFNLNLTGISARDSDADSPGRTDRGYSFKNRITEVSAGIEFDFFEFDLHHFDPQITPYVFTGLSYFRYNELYVENGETRQDGRRSGLGIPMMVGVKMRIGQDFVLGLEVGFRYTFTDNLDGSNPKKPELAPLRFGNLNSNDWYVMSGFTLTYTFGDNPCFCPR